MKVSVNQETCQGYGMCASLAPGLFGIQSDARVREMREDPIEPGLVDAVRAAVDACPTQSIWVTD